MANRFSLAIQDIVRETPEAVTIILERPNDKKLSYQPGQFLTFRLRIHTQTVRRSYALSSSPDVDQQLAITVKRLPGGLASCYLCDQAKKGDRLETTEPRGSFFPELDSINNRTFVLIGVGSGIVPLFSIAKSVLVGEPKSRVWLIYGNHSQESILFKAQLDAMESAYGSLRFRTIHVLSQPARGYTGPVGHLNKKTLIHLLVDLPAPERARASFFVCAPEGVRRQTLSALALFWIPAGQVFSQSYSPPLSELLSNQWQEQAGE